MSRALAGLLGVLLVAACTFAPDLSRFMPCDEQGACPSGSTCLASEARCVPDCEGPLPCGVTDPVSDAGDAGGDAGPGDDGGTDAGTDAGTGGGSDAGPTTLALESDGLATGVEGAPYSGQLRAHGGTPPYTFTAAAAAALPAGLTLNGEGQLSGTPAAAGMFYLSVDVTDASTPPKRASGSVPLRVRARLHLAGPGTLADAPEDSAYVEHLSATGGKPPYRFTLAPGSALPAGLELAEDGGVTGTSAQEGKVEFTVHVTDSDSPSQAATREVSISTVDAGLALRIMTQALPDARVGTVYSYTLRVAGGTGPYSWAVADGWELPPGLRLDGSQGLLHGTPTRSGDFTVRIIATDLLQSRNRDLTLQVD
jgi:hypothetical protein